MLVHMPPYHTRANPNQFTDKYSQKHVSEVVSNVSKISDSSPRIRLKAKLISREIKSKRAHGTVRLIFSKGPVPLVQ